MLSFYVSRNLDSFPVPVQRTTVNFGPQINFVIGHNGSGKSAVLSGIAIALGGRSASTGRGTGLKSFIKEGERCVTIIT
jgi:chromosome segregation ATPase